MNVLAKIIQEPQNITRFGSFELLNKHFSSKATSQRLRRFKVLGRVEPHRWRPLLSFTGAGSDG